MALKILTNGLKIFLVKPNVVICTMRVMNNLDHCVDEWQIDNILAMSHSHIFASKLQNTLLHTLKKHCQVNINKNHLFMILW